LPRVTIPDPKPPDRPTRARFVLAGWLCALAAILYLDRICMSQAVPPIRDELKLSNEQMSYVAMAFTIAYGIFEVPTGRWGDRVGGRAVLTRIALWWSAFTALTGAGFGLISLVVIRFLFGAGEAGAYPNVARVLSRWVPALQRGRVQGFLLAAAQLGAVAAPVLAAYLIDAIGWRGAFAVFGGVGVGWAVGFWLWFRDDPADHPGVNVAELELIRAGTAAPEPTREPVPWRAVLTNPGVWLLGLCTTCAAFNTYFYFSWFPTYLMDARGVSNTAAGWLSSLALAGSAVGVFAGGFAADRLTRLGPGRVWGRRLFCAAACWAAGGLLLAAAHCKSPVALASLAAASTTCLLLTLPTWWSAAIEQSGRHVGALFGLMNSLGVVGALASQWFVGAFADWQAARGLTGRAQWDPIFNVYVAVLGVGGWVWVAYRYRPLPGQKG
jgi:ACS family glucarate transporter-like MFS transporter